MIKNYGHFQEKLGGFTLTKFPKVGNYEYIYKNDDIEIDAEIVDKEFLCDTLNKGIRE